MTKNEFLVQLSAALAALPSTEIDLHLSFYGEMIDDRMEEGLSEAEAVAELGTPREIAAQILSMETTTASAKPQKKQMSLMIILLLVLGSPIWLSLALSAMAVVFAIFVSLWSVGVYLWACFASFVGTAIGMLFVCGVYVYHGKLLAALGFLGMVLISVALSILLFFASLYATKGCVWLVKQSVRIIKRIIGKRGSKM